MKKFSTFLALLLGLTTMAQVPQSFNYQGVARNSTGQPLANQNIGVRFSIIKTNASGTVEYTETHNATTNAYGLFTLNVGGGTPVSGTFSGIDWIHGPKFLKLEIDPAGGTSYTHIGTTQLLSVPYAQFAGNGDKTVTLTGQGGVQVSGTYPNFTVGLPPVQQFLPTGKVRGRIYVVDEHNNVLLNEFAGVKAEIDSVSTLTDSIGWFELANLTPGEHELKLSKAGFCAASPIMVNIIPGGVTYGLVSHSGMIVSKSPTKPIVLDTGYVTTNGSVYIGNSKQNVPDSQLCAVYYFSKDSLTLSHTNYYGTGDLKNTAYVGNASTIKAALGLSSGSKVYFIAYPIPCNSPKAYDKYYRTIACCMQSGIPSAIRSVTLP